MQPTLSTKKIGIWGFGVSGKSIFAYLLRNNACAVGILEKNIPLQPPASATTVITFYPDTPGATQLFLQEHDIIIPSPGVDLRPYQKFAPKFLSELDLFYAT